MFFVLPIQLVIFHKTFSELSVFFMPYWITHKECDHPAPAELVQFCLAAQPSCGPLQQRGPKLLLLEGWALRGFSSSCQNIGDYTAGAVCKDRNSHSYIKELVSPKNWWVLQLPDSRTHKTFVIPPPLLWSSLCHNSSAWTGTAWTQGNSSRCKLVSSRLSWPARTFHENTF